MNLRRPTYGLCHRIAALAIFIIAMTVYALTAEPTASFWDCPEYITTGARLEIGHPPGNPTWTLAARMAATIAPSESLVPLFINLTSGLFTALSAMLLYLSVPLLCALGRRRYPQPRDPLTTANALPCVAGAVAALTFAFLDSTWFSAVEAEVYAFSIFCTALCVYLALLWAKRRDPRLVILMAYIFGLSIGVHQLNLLCIPAVALIMLFAVRPERISFWRTAGVVLLSFVIIAAILFGIMPGLVWMAERFELVAVYLGAPFHVGELCALFLALFVPVVLAFCIPRLATPLWSLALLILGYSTFLLIIIRAEANPPMNQGAPSDVFAFSSYLGRDQYGSTPLLYGRTPQSRPLKQERLYMDGDSVTRADYSVTTRTKHQRQYFRRVPGAVVHDNLRMLTAEDSAHNAAAESSTNSYVIGGYAYEFKYAPELNMLFPRITSSNSDHLEAYESWIGMTDSTMVAVKASEAVDSAGRAVGIFDVATQSRVKRDARRPSYMQNALAFFSYQVSYMYLRYLMWNFVGRQNDIPSQGQVDAGNFITGFDVIDDAMIGPQSPLPPHAGLKNPGRNTYYAIPLLLALLGMAAQVGRSRRTTRQFYITLMLFLMTGLAIVVYLNQSPCEPRERDYSFIGSFYAFSIWVGVGAAYIVDRIAALKYLRTPKARTYAFVITSILSLGVPAMLLAKNWDDHDRSGRTVTSDIAANTLETLLPNAIIFVNGDNYTFPLWYSQDVEGVRRDVRVVNIAYLSTSWYPSQFFIPAYEADPIPMFASIADLAYNSFQSAYISNDTIATDAREAFRYLYDSGKRGGTPAFPSGRIRIPSSSGDSIVIPLRNVVSGRNTMLRQNIIMLDIIAANAYSDRPRPIYWSAALPDSYKASLGRYAVYDGLALRLTDSIADHTPADPERLADLILHRFRYGDMSRPGIWLDQPGHGQVQLLRRTIRITASEMLDRGKPQTALQLMRLHNDRLPAAVSPYTTYTDRYVLRNEAVETARLLIRCADQLRQPALRDSALDILKHEITTLAQWRNYYNKLPRRLQGVTSPHVLLYANALYAPIDAYLLAGGDPAFIDRHPLLGYIDLNKEKTAWTVRQLRRQLLHDARYPVNTDSTKAHLDEYLRLGGKPADLMKYTEIKNAPDFPPIPSAK